MLRSLVGSEMCIRDRPSTASVAMSRGMLDQSAHKPKVREHTISSRLKSSPPHSARVSSVPRQRHSTSSPNPNDLTCLLYTSDAADEEDSVDLGGRRIIKKKNTDMREI
eukprot:TRINITY_DN26409_c0_g1_i1.p2 TRINITY_DN26409_c0_g1~~TRINITY_DN26409_c0_g1_i1.p2  ORF type:complete len:109 (+),score=31.43 TRINITY_DN26409_c0_g1_i1:158-484(+)